jgi:hypothetical protein
MENLHQFVYSPEVLNFIRECKLFTDLMEQEESGDRDEMVGILLENLPALYAGMMRIPQTEAVFDTGNEKFVTEEDWAAVYKRVYVVMGSQNEYTDIPENEDYDRSELITRELSEDLADIYQDVKDFIMLYRNGTDEIMNDAIWECRMNFENYWGEKLLRASRQLHAILIRDPEILDEMDREFNESGGRKDIDARDWIISRKQRDFNREQGDFS